jgi:uncharacterized protein
LSIRLGYVRELVRYPVKSMAGNATESVFVGLHGLQGDRRFAFRRLNDNGSGFPWLTASRLPEMVLFKPLGFDERADESAPTHVRTPDGAEFALESDELQDEIARRFGSAVELMRLRHGVFDDASLSIINLATIDAICREAGTAPDSRRFRPNVVIESDAVEPFLEDAWIGGSLVFGENGEGPIVGVTQRDVRCMVINLDPDTAKQDPSVMRTVVRLNDNKAGAYGAVVRTGWIRVGQLVRLIPDFAAALHGRDIHLT